MKTDLFQSCDHCWVSQICWHIECSTFTASSFRIWNSSTAIPSPPLALFIMILSRLTWLHIPNLYAGQEATVRTVHGTTDWFQIGKGVRQGCILSPCLFNLLFSSLFCSIDPFLCQCYIVLITVTLWYCLKSDTGLCLLLCSFFFFPSRFALAILGPL